MTYRTISPPADVWLDALEARDAWFLAFCHTDLRRRQLATLEAMFRRRLAFWSGTWMAPPPPTRPRLTLVRSR